jgi:hypothetical protein
MRDAILPTGTSIPPNVPRLRQPRSFPLFADLWAGFPFVITIIPLPYVFCNLYLGLVLDIGFTMELVLPWEAIMASQVKKFERTLSSTTRGHVADI